MDSTAINFIKRYEIEIKIKTTVKRKRNEENHMIGHLSASNDLHLPNIFM